MKTIAAIILAAGQGKRMQSQDVNKVALLLGDKPMIAHTVHRLQDMGISPIVVVIGFAKESVIAALSGTNAVFAEQKELLGTANAVASGMEKLPSATENVLVFQGDDSAFYSSELITEMIDTHVTSGASVTFLTIEVANPFGLGRVVRKSNGEVTAIVEEKDANDEQRNITEINPACYVFSTTFLKKYLDRVGKSVVTGEYYLTALIDLAIAQGEQVETVQGGKLAWRGVNTKEELEEAERMFGGK